MSTTTEKLALFKYDPSTDGAQTFNISKALNENWDKIDDAVKEILITLANKVNNDRPMMLPFSLLDGYSARYHCAYYRNALGDVTLELCFSGPITTSWTDVGILPEGYRPSSSLYIPAVASPGGGNDFFAIGAYVGATGYVKVRSPNNYSDVEITINTSFLAL